MLRKSLAASVGLGFLAVSCVLLAVAYSTSSWLVSDYRGSDYRLGLWSHCDISSDPISATQIFLMICFELVSMNAIFSLFHFLGCSSDMSEFVKAIEANAVGTMLGGIFGAIAIIVFASSNHNGWTPPPGHYNYSFGWSFVLACLGVICSFIASSLFITYLNSDQKKKDKLKDITMSLELESILTKK